MAVGAAGLPERDRRPVHRGTARRDDRRGAAGRRETSHRRGGPADGRARRVLRGGPRRPGRPGLVRSTRRPGAGLRAGYAFDVPYRDEDAVGDIKQIWEPSRHQHLTVLAAAYAITGDERYAERVAEHLRSWWAANPPLRGVHWISGIELGIRLLSWVWIRRLLDGWPGAAGLFEGNPVALHQIWHHQRWLAAFPSRGPRRTTTSSPRPPGSSPRPARSAGSPRRRVGGPTRCGRWSGSCAATPSTPASTASWPPSITDWCWSSAWPRWPRRMPPACRSPRRSGWCCCG